MKLSDLRTFAEIVDAGGLTPAAERLGVTQPALSRTLRDLETRMRAQLFRRTGRGMELTQAGAEFLAFAAEALHAFEQTRLRILETEGAVPGQLTLTVPLRLGRLLIPVLHRQFAQRLPETALHVLEESTDRYRGMLDATQIDGAIIYAQADPIPQSKIPLAAEALFAVGTETTLGHSGTPIRLGELADMPVLAPNRGSYRKLLDATFSGHGHRLRITRELETAEGLLAFAAEGDGIAILPMSNIYQECARGEVIARPIVSPEITRLVMFHPGRAMSRHVLNVVMPILRASVSEVSRLARWRSSKTPEPSSGGAARKTLFAEPPPV